MTFRELTQLNKGIIRGNSDFTLFFINAYQHIFGYKPSCSGCSINNEMHKLFERIKQMPNQDLEILIDKDLIMENTDKTFVKSINFKENLIAYKDENGRIRRKFANKLTDDFVIAYLTNGTPEELEDRRKKFKVLPLAMREVKEEPKKEKKKREKKVKEVAEVAEEQTNELDLND